MRTLKKVCVAGVPKTVNFYTKSAVSEGANHTECGLCEKYAGNFVLSSGRGWWGGRVVVVVGCWLEWGAVPGCV